MHYFVNLSYLLVPSLQYTVANRVCNYASVRTIGIVIMLLKCSEKVVSEQVASPLPSPRVDLRD